MDSIEGHAVQFARQRPWLRIAGVEFLEVRQMLTSVTNLPSLVQGIEDVFVDVDLSSAEFFDDEPVVLAISSSAGRFQLNNLSPTVSANLVQDGIVLIRGNAASINTFFDQSDSVRFAVDAVESRTDTAVPTIEIFDYQDLERRSLGTIEINLPPQRVNSEPEIWFGAPELIDQDAGVHPLVPGQYALWMYTDPIEWRFCNYPTGWCFEVSGSHLQLEDEGIEFAAAGRDGNRSFEFQDGTIFEAAESPDEFQWLDVSERPAIQDYIGTPIIGRIPSENLYFEILPEYAERVCPRCDPHFPENGAGFHIEYGYQVSTNSPAFQTNEDADTATVDLLGGFRDPEGGSLSVSGLKLETGDQAGITVGPNNQLTVVPSVYDHLPEGRSELIRADFTIADELGGEIEQAIDLIIQGRNDQPTVGKSLVYQVSEGAEALEIDLLESASDVDRTDRLTVGEIRFAVDGKSTRRLPAGVKLDGHTLTFDPGPYSALKESEVATIVATYPILDSFGGQVQQTLNVTVHGRGASPQARDDWFVTAANVSVTHNIVTNDSDDAELDISTIDLNPGLAGDQSEFAIENVGTFRLVDDGGTVEFAPAAGYFGTAIAPYTIRDDEGFLSAPGVIRAKVNQPPTALPDAAYTLRGRSTSIPIGRNDVDDDGFIDVESVDLDPQKPGQQSSIYIEGVGTFADEVTDLQKSYTLTGIIDSSVGGESFRDRLMTITIQAEFISDDGFMVGGSTSFFIEAMGRIESSDLDGKPRRLRMYFGDGKVSLVDGVAGHSPGTGFVYVAAHEQFEAFSSDATILPIPVEVTAGPYGYRTTGGMFGLSNIRDAVFQSHDPKPRRSGNITFTPVADFVGSASISYTINDENGFTSNPTDLTITVIPGTDTAADVITVNESADAQIVDLLTGVSDPFASIAAANIVGDDRGIELIGSQLHVEPAVYRDLNKGSISVIGVQFTVNRMSGSETRAIEIRITGDSESRLGDLDGDGVVSLADFAVLRWNYGSTKAGQEDGDLNGDAVVDFQDYVILKENLGHSV